MHITAQDFMDCMNHQEDKKKGFEYLLSKARQEAASEKEEEMRRYMEQKVKEAKQIARREALKEMDEAYLFYFEASGVGDDNADSTIEKLRQEYSNQP